MFNIILFATMLQGPVYRQSADTYAIPGYNTVETNNCTVSANGELTAIVTKDWIYFYDRDGHLEADCQLLTRARPVVTLDITALNRGIATW